MLVHVDDPRHGIARSTQGLAEEAFGSRGIALGGEQEIDRLAGGIDRPVQVAVLALDLNIGLVGAVALVG